MLILAVDTSGKNGSLALVRFEGAASDTLELVCPMVNAPQFAADFDALEQARLHQERYRWLRGGGGVGSFTGLRVASRRLKP
jgi:tRNA A37 threonylcarbamoyladenosine modification protein TsaB